MHEHLVCPQCGSSDFKRIDYKYYRRLLIPASIVGVILFIIEMFLSPTWWLLILMLAAIGASAFLFIAMLTYYNAPSGSEGKCRKCNHEFFIRK